MESLDLEAPRGNDFIDVRRPLFSDSDSDSEYFQLPPDVIREVERDLSIVPQQLVQNFRRIRPIPAGLTPPRMPRITNYQWAGAGDWEAAAGIGETIHTDSPWTSIEADVVDDLFRPVRSFVDARIRAASLLHPFVDEDSADDDIQSVDSYGNPLLPIVRGPDEPMPRGRARPGALPPQTGGHPHRLPHRITLERDDGNIFEANFLLLSIRNNTSY